MQRDTLVQAGKDELPIENSQSIAVGA